MPACDDGWGPRDRPGSHALGCLIGLVGAALLWALILWVLFTRVVM